jgi:hypothetical protein
MKTFSCVTFLFLFSFFILLSCSHEKKDNAQTSTDSVDVAVKEVIERLQSIEDSTNSVSSKNLEVLSNAWIVGTFIDEYGESTDKRFIKTGVVGHFSNSATSNGYLFAEVLLHKEAAGIFLHEYEMTNPAEKFIGTARIKMKNSLGKELEIFTGSEWSQEGGLLIANFTAVEGAEDYDFSNFRKFIKRSEGEIKVVIYDKYSSTYRFNLSAGGFNEAYNSL